MSDKNTPGPWKFGYTDNLEYPIILGADNEIVCVMREGVSIKDGKLLAMAPELLESLQEIVAAADGAGWSQLDATLAKASAAIAKATVEQE